MIWATAELTKSQVRTRATLFQKRQSFHKPAPQGNLAQQIMLRHLKNIYKNNPRGFLVCIPQTRWHRLPIICIMTPVRWVHPPNGSASTTPKRFHYQIWIVVGRHRGPKPDLLARVDLLVDEGNALRLTDLKTARSHWS